MTKDILDKAKELERDIESLRILIKEKESGDGLCVSLTITDSQSDSRKSCVTG